MSGVVKKSLPKQIADIIETKIKNGEYKVGDKLPTESELMDIFGVSRNTLREAIQSLTHLGIIETRQGDGTYVTATERFEVEFYNIMNSTTNQNILEVRNLLEHHIVCSAIKNALPEDIEEIKRLLYLRKDEKNSIRENTAADLNFHLGIAKATHNDIIVSVYKYVSEYFSRFIYEKLYQHKKDQKDIDEIHDLMFVAIRDKNTELATKCVNKIIEI